MSGRVTRTGAPSVYRQATRIMTDSGFVEVPVLKLRYEFPAGNMAG